MTFEAITKDKLDIVGSRPPRVDAKSKVTGQALYGPDINLPGMLHGKTLRSPHAHARIRSIDASKAEALPGVYGVITAADFPEVADVEAEAGETMVNYKRLADNNLASDKVFYVGHAVAAVAASSLQIAEEAIKLIEVDYEVLPPVLDVRKAMQPDAPLLHEELHTDSLAGKSEKPSNIARHFQHVKGDLEQGFAEADIIVEREFRTAPVHQGYIEPHGATAVWGADGALTIYASTQGVFLTRQQVSELLRYPMSKIKVIPTEVGGGFGGKSPSYIEAPAALLSRKTGHPVRIVMSRADVLRATGPTSGTYIKVKMGATKEGKLTAAQAELCYEAGAYPGSPVGAGAMVLLAGYDIPNGQIDGYDVVVNKPRTAAYRAPGGTQAGFAAEQVIDELAEKLGMDPVEFRLKNVAHEGTRRLDGPLHKSIAAEEILGTVLDHPHYNAPLDGPNQGRGVALGFWGNWGARSSVAINVNSDGTVSLISGSVDLTGSRTSVAMQAAEILDLPLDKIKSTHTDTDSIGYANTSGGSRTTMATGIAAIEAARDVVAQMRAEAAKVWEVPAETVTYEKGTFKGQTAEQRLSFEALAGRLSGPLTGQGNVNVEDWGGAFGAHIVDVEVDPETGQVKILRYTTIQNAGKAIHPGQVEGQMQGGAVQGIGWALFEGYEYNEDGQLLNPNLLDYKLPTALDVPEIEAVILEKPFPGHPLGVRGVGETPIVPPAAAIANAVYRAIGKRVNQLPITPARILETLEVI